MADLSTADAVYMGSTAVTAVYLGDTKVWPTIPEIPVLTSISPTSMFNLDGAKTITASGVFYSGCVLQIKGTGGWVNVNASTLVSETTMTGSLDMGPGNYLVSVVDGGDRSAELAFQGQHNTPGLTAISPTSIHTSQAGQRLTVTGSNYYAGLTIYVLQPGGSWQGRAATVTSATSAYSDGFDPGVGGTWKIMTGYDVPNAPRSPQLNLQVDTGAMITSVTPASQARGPSFDLIVRGYGLAGTQTITMGIDTVDGIGYWTTSATDTEVRIDDHYLGVFDPVGLYDLACRSGQYDGPIIASKTDCFQVT